MRRFRAATLWTAAGAALLAASTSLAGPAALVAIEHQGAGRVFYDAKDQPLLTALGKLPGWLRVMAEAEDGDEAPIGAIDLLEAFFAAPARFAVVDHGPDPDTGAPGLAVTFELTTAREAGAARMHESVRSLGGRIGPLANLAPAEDGSGALEAPTPLGTLRFEVVEGPEGWRYRAHVGRETDLNEVFADDDGERYLRARIDLAAISPLLAPAQMLAAGEPGGAQLFQMLGQMGLVGPEAMAIEVDAWGNDSHRAIRATARRFDRVADALGFVEGPLSDATLRTIPQDAHYFEAAAYDLSAFWGFIESLLALAPPDEQDELQAFLDELGVDPGADLFDPLGDQIAWYGSRTTGGPGLSSLVVALELDDAARFAGTVDRLAARANAALAAEMQDTPAQIRFEQFEARGVRFTQLQAPGLPVPFAPTLAIAGDWLIVGATPTAAQGAAAQALGRGPSILDNARFREGSFEIEGVRQAMAFVDTGATLDRGYPTLSLIGVALDNLVMDPGVRGGLPASIPSLPDLARDTRALVAVGARAEDSYIVEAHADPSVVADLGGIMGVQGDSIASAAMLAGVLLPALGRARDSAQQLKGAAILDEEKSLKDAENLNDVWAGLMEYAIESGPGGSARVAFTLEQMVRDGFVQAESVRSPFGPSEDGGPGYAMSNHIDIASRPSAHVILGYSRAAWFTQPRVFVVYADGRIAAHPKDELRRLLEQSGPDFDWMIPGE